MRRLVQSWQRGFSLAVVLALILTLAAIFTFVPFVLACELALWLGLRFIEDPRTPGEVWWTRAFEYWQLSAVLWVPLALHIGWPQLAHLARGWEFEDEWDAREAERTQAE